MEEERPFAEEKGKMLKTHLQARGIKDKMTLKAMETVPRHRFVPKNLQDQAYDDCPLPIGKGQTISQPYIVALMTQCALTNADSKVLDIGTGSGYAASIFSRMVREVVTIERIASLAQEAKRRFQELSYDNILLVTGDGSLGSPEHSPFDAIVVGAGAPNVPESLLKQLSIGGCLIIPVGDASSQKLLRIRKNSDGTTTRENIEYVRFVPLIGEEGW